MKQQKRTLFRVIFIELEKVHYFLKLLFYRVHPTNFSKQEFIENIYYYLQERSLLDFFF